jgi:hypothetical protein
MTRTSSVCADPVRVCRSRQVELLHRDTVCYSYMPLPSVSGYQILNVDNLSFRRRLQEVLSVSLTSIVGALGCCFGKQEIWIVIGTHSKGLEGMALIAGGQSRPERFSNSGCTVATACRLELIPFL